MVRIGLSPGETGMSSPPQATHSKGLSQTHGSLSGSQKRHVPGATSFVTNPNIIEITPAEENETVGGPSVRSLQTEVTEKLQRALHDVSRYTQYSVVPQLRSFYTQCEPSLRDEERPLTYPILWASAAIWTLCLAIGLILHAGAAPPHVVRQTHWLPLLWFDRLFRQWGVLLAAPVLAARYGANVVSRQRSTWVAARRDHHYGEAAAFYFAMAIVRAIVYILHTTRVFWLTAHIVLGAKAGAAVDVMSDHFFLASCIAAVLTVECCLAYVEWRRSSRPPLRSMLLLAGMGYAAAAYVLLSLDMLYTARFFHGRHETFWGAFCGLAFPVSACIWMLYGVQGSPKLMQS